jgi:signal transduction histidine kinase
MEIRIRKPNGGELTVLTNSAPIKDTEGHITAAVAAIMDITRLKATERELQEAKSEAEMYLDLMGHDINNLNQVGIGYLELALNELDARGRLEEKDRPLLDKTFETLLNSSKLIGNVRKIQKSQAGGLKFMPLDLCEVLEKIKLQYSSIPDREVHIRLNATRQCYIYANDLIHDVFTNLIGNAIKHSSAVRSLDIDIYLKKIDRGGRDFYEITIDDNGPGIPDDVKAMLFARFERGKTKASGRGLGLYLVRTLLKDMGGSVTVEDRVKGDDGKGARFIVILPALEEK